MLILLNVHVSFPNILLEALLKYSLFNSYFGNLHVFSVGLRVQVASFSSTGSFVYEPVRCFFFEFRGLHFRASKVLRFRVRTRVSVSNSACFVFVLGCFVLRS